MANYCRCCGKKISWFANHLLSESVCDECKKKKDIEIQAEQVKSITELDQMKNEVISIGAVNANQLERIKSKGKEWSIKFYTKVYDAFKSDREISEKELDILKNIQEGLSLTKDDIKYDDIVLPYVYVALLKKENKLPTINLVVDTGMQIILKKDEVIHFASKASLNEMRVVNLGYESGSHGVSFRIMKGVSYRIGASKGHVIKEERLIETSRGIFLVTNQRLFLHPIGDNKPLSIPLNKILSYSCFSNGIQFYKEGREKGYFISMEKNSSVEIAGLCLGHLVSRNFQ
jgi:hypothetical protein